MSKDLANATSVLLISPRTGKVLGATRRGTTDQWGLIGGKRDEGESIDDCAMREFFEEVGIRLSQKPVHIFTRDCEPGADGKGFYVAVYMVRCMDDILDVQGAFPEPREVEPGILVGFVDYIEVMKGPFGAFNAALLSSVLAEFSRSKLV